MGDETHWNSFANFVEVVSGARVTVDGLDVTYHSPSVGRMQFGWHGPLQVGSAEVEILDYPRFHNPYCQADFAARQYTIRYGDQTYNLDFSFVNR